MLNLLPIHQGLFFKMATTSELNEPQETNILYVKEVYKDFTFTTTNKWSFSILKSEGHY